MAEQRYVPTAALQKSLQKGSGVCVNLLSQVEYLEELAKAAPEIEQDVARIRLKLEHLDMLCRTGLNGVATTLEAPERP